MLDPICKFQGGSMTTVLTENDSGLATPRNEKTSDVVVKDL
jgi:hypothetical protein